jgi:hypothetical protein
VLFEQIDWTDLTFVFYDSTFVLFEQIDWTDLTFVLYDSTFEPNDCLDLTVLLNVKRLDFLCCLRKLIEHTFVLIIQWLVFCVVWASRLNGLTFVLFEQNDWRDLTVLLNVKQLNFLCCTLNDFDLCVVWVNWMNGLLCCMLNDLSFVLYVKWLDFCVVWANWMNGLL